MKYARNIEKNFLEALSESPAILLGGARQTGKTTLAEDYTKGHPYFHATFDDLSVLAAAKRDPKGFIEGLPKPVMIDEVQRVSEIFLPIKLDIDKNRLPGRYILTGSANLLLINHVGESLAGRLETLTLYPLSQGELRNRKEDFIKTVFSSEPLPLPTETVTKDELYKLITRGGYPVVQSRSDRRRQVWFQNYINDILLKDVKNLENIEKLTEIPHLLKFLSFRAGHPLNVSDLSNVLGLSQSTLRRYLVLLKKLYMINYCEPWRSSAEKRLIKTPRVYLTDTGILCSLQGLTAERMASEPQLTGHVLENFVWAELTKQASWSDIRVEIYHFRLSTGLEVDILLEDSMGNIVGIEIKNSSTPHPGDLKGLEHLQQILGKKFTRGILLYTGSDFIPYSEKLCALPLSSLWQ